MMTRTDYSKAAHEAALRLGPCDPESLRLRAGDACIWATTEDGKRWARCRKLPGGQWDITTPAEREDLNPDHADSVEERFSRDVLTVACEGGVNYWAEARDLQRTRPGGDVISVELRDSEDPEAEWCVVTPREVADAVRRILHPQKYPTNTSPHLRGALAAAWSAGEFGSELDAGAADAIVQVACFDEVTFG